MKKYTFLALAALGAILIAGFTLWPNAATVAEAKIFTGKTSGVAINGYDTVAYHTQKKPVLGNAAFSYQWSGTAWHFSSAENLQLFKVDPKKYAPQYGGYCAYAAANKAVAKTEPEAFTLVGGKLYLNFDQNIKRRWDRDKSEYIKAADKYWLEISRK